MQVRLYQPEPPTSIQSYCNSGIWSTSLDTPDLNQIIGDSTRQRSTVLSRGSWGIHWLSRLFKPIPLVPGVLTTHIPLLRSTDSCKETMLTPRSSCGWWLQAHNTPAAPRRTILYFTLEEYTDFQYFIYSESDEERSETRANEI